MGHKHSKRPRRPTTQPEVTEIIELYDNQSELDDVPFDIDDAHPPIPQELTQILTSIELVEKSISAMSASQLDLYYATLKDDLHSQWQRLYHLPDGGDAFVKDRKIEAIERLKAVLKRLNGRVLMNG